MSKTDSQNIQIGIDLGTTNSEVAIYNNGEVEVVKNILGDEYTPSVFGIDRSGNKIVGKRAYEKLYKDPSADEFANNKAEVKRLMGTSQKVEFPRAEKEFSPEEISAEVLKSLKEDILRKHPDFDTRAAVVTIPAYFSTLQAEATKRAASLAGFEYAVLLQEPIAAAIAYGFMGTEDENWIVYDLGGGTFDVALISSKEGSLSVLSHSGNNFLGGKDFDWLIVDRIIVPAILEKYEIEDFNRGNHRYKSTFSKLKYIAENAKIYLSQYEQANIEIEGIGNDDNNEEIYLNIDLSRDDFESLIKPAVDQTIEATKEVIKDSGVKSSTVNKIVLVGAPTQIPYIKTRLEREFQIVVDTSSDPLTAVARGACIFATSQRIPKDVAEKNKQIKEGTKSLTLYYDSLTSDTEETVTGIIEELKDSQEEFYVQIQSESGLYSGSKIKLNNGKFFDTITLEPNKTNLFWVYLFDNEGNSVSVDPDSFTITHGLSISGAPIPHSIGVAVAKRDAKSSFALTEVFEPFFEKGSTLPLKSEPYSYKTVTKLEKGNSKNSLPIKVYEGESEIPDRNELICELEVTGDQVPYDLPEGTEVQITIEVNESREVSVEAFIPTIDLTLNARATIHAEEVDVSQMQSELNAQRERVKSVEKNCSPSERDQLQEVVQSASTSLENAEQDEDERRKAHKQLKNLKVKLDEMEKSKELPQLESEFKENLKSVEEVIEKLGDSKDKEMNNDQLEALREEGEKAIQAKDKYLLLRVNEQLQDLAAKVALSNPSVWAYQFEKMASGEYKFTSEKEAEYYINKGRRAIELNDFEELKRCVHGLLLLLPPEDQEEVKGNLSGITYK